MLTGCFFTSKPLKQWPLEPEGATAFALSRDGRFAVTYSEKNQLRVWDLQQNKKLADLGALDQLNSIVSKIRVSDNDRYAITAGQNNFAVWDLAWSQAKGLWSISDGIILDVDLSSDGQQVLLGLSNGKAIYVDLVSGRRMEFLAHREKVNSVALSANGRYALSGGNDYKAYLWDTQSGQILREFEHEQRVVRVALQRDGKLAFTSDGGNDAKIWDIKTGQSISHLKSFARQLIFTTARFSDDGHFLVTGSPNGQLSIWRSETGENLEKYDVEVSKVTRPPRGVVYDATFIADDQQVISASSAGVAESWQIGE
jgi:WD40 repeat protein